MAKLIYDATISGMPLDDVKRQVLESYAYLNKISKDEMEEKIDAFLPLIPLERDMSLIKRKPQGYETEIFRDLFFIRTLYDLR